MTNEKHQCQVCRQTAYVEVAGKYYCDAHDPAIVALSQCLQVNPDNPLAVAETIKEAFTLLYSIKELSQGYSFPYDEVNRAVGNLLAKANKKQE